MGHAASGFEQVGCVYTAQGFEYDWDGVIIGPDLIPRDGKLVTVRSAKDTALTRSVIDEQADRLIRNTYKVLLTRGMVDTAVYAVDRETRNSWRILSSWPESASENDVCCGAIGAEVPPFHTCRSFDFMMEVLR